MKQPSFEITGLPKAGSQQPNSIGQPHGEIGADLQKTAAARLATQTPTQTNKSLEAALMQRYGLSKQLRAAVLVGEPDYAMIPIRDDVDYDAAYNAVSLAMVPASDEMIIGALGVLEAKCKRGKESDGAGDLGLRVFVAELRKFPADVVLSVLSDWGDENVFAPSWHELKQRLDKVTQKRRDILASLMWSKGRTFKEVKPVEQVSGKSWQEAPDYGMAQPAMPIRDKADMAKQLREMGQA